jgi:hypothetical protein
MRKQDMSKKIALRRTLVALGGTLVAVVWLFATPALAGHKHKHKHHNRHQTTLMRPVQYGRHVQVPPRILHAPRRLAAPMVIRRNHVENYGPYHGGRVFYGPHGHDHEVYYFPVYRDHRYIYEPHYYCGGHRVSTSHVAYHGPNVSFRIAF